MPLAKVSPVTSYCSQINSNLLSEPARPPWSSSCLPLPPSPNSSPCSLCSSCWFSSHWTHWMYSILRDSEFALLTVWNSVPQIFTWLPPSHSGCNSNITFSERWFLILYVAPHSVMLYCITLFQLQQSTWQYLKLSVHPAPHVCSLFLPPRGDTSWGKYSAYCLHGYILSGRVSAWYMGEAVSICWLTHWPLGSTSSCCFSSLVIGKK